MKLTKKNTALPCIRLLCSATVVYFKNETRVLCSCCLLLQALSLLHLLRRPPHLSHSTPPLAHFSTCRSGICCFPASGETHRDSQACPGALRLLGESMSLLYVNRIPYGRFMPHVCISNTAHTAAVVQHWKKWDAGQNRESSQNI